MDSLSLEQGLPV